METRRDREKSRYRRGMASQTGQLANKRAEEIFSSTCLNLPKEAKLFQIKSDKPLRMDILPYEVGTGNPFADLGSFHYERTYWAHRGIGPDNKSYPCPRENTRGKDRCPICEHREKLREDPEANEDLITSLKPKRRQIFNIIDLNNRDAGVQIWDISFHLFGNVLLEFLDDEEFSEERRDWCEFEGGKSLRLGLKEKTFNKQKFYEVTRIDLMDRKSDYDPEKMLEKVFCLDKVIKTISYEDLSEVFLQTGSEDESHSNKHFKESDVKKIQEMSEKELVKFVLLNDMDVTPDDHDTLEDLQAAVIAEVTASLEGGDTPPAENDEDTIKVGSMVTWDDDGDDKSGEVVKVKGDKAVVKDDDDEEFKVALDELTLVKPKAAGKKDKVKEEAPEAAEIEEGSEVTWTDEDEDDHEGTVIEIKGKKAIVKEGKVKLTVPVKDLTIKDD
jgi:hypothetical protein